jgi:hypothetical protein
MLEQETTPLPKFSLKGLAARIILAILSICITLFLLEVAVRFLPRPYTSIEGLPPLFSDQVNILTCGPPLGWTGIPNFEGSVSLPENTANLKFNAWGMHDSNHTPARSPNTYRILMLGDSYIHAVQVNEAQTAHQVLEDYLNQREQAKYEVISGGVTGWGTGQELLYYRQQGRDFQPDVVLLMLFIGNDFENNLPGYALTIDKINCYAPYLAMCDGQLNPEPLSYAPGISNLTNGCSAGQRMLIKGLGTLYQYSRLYQQIEPLIISQRPRQIFGKQYPNSFWALYIPTDRPEPALERAWQTTEGLIKQLRHEVEADGARFGVVFFTWSVIIDMSLLPPEQLTTILQENPAFANAQTDRPNRRLAQFLSTENIPFLDLTPLIRQHQAELNEPLHYVGDGHWTIEGNRFVAEVLAQWTKDNELLSK